MAVLGRCVLTFFWNQVINLLQFKNKLITPKFYLNMRWIVLFLVFFLHLPGSLLAQSRSNVTGVGSSEQSSDVRITEFPWSEDFEQSGGVMPDGWSIEHVKGELDWMVSQGGHDSNYKVMIPFGNGPVTRLITPVFDLSELDNPVLKFYRLQQPWGTVVDILRIYYKNSESGEWTLLKEFDDGASDWTETLVSLAEPSLEYQIAFESELKFANGISLDDICVEQAAPAPVISSDAYLNLGDIYNNLPWPRKASYKVENRGLLPLQISGASNVSAGMEIEGLPVEIASMQSAEITVVVDASGFPAGEFSGSFALVSDDPMTPELSVSVEANVTSAVISNYIEENFNGVDPEGWGTVACTKIFEGGIDNSPCIRALLHQNQPQGGVQTSYVMMGSNPVVSFSYKIVGYATGLTASAGAMSYAVYVSNDGGNTFNILFSGASGEPDDASGYINVNIDGAEYANELCLVQIVFEPEEGGEYWLYIDDITIGTKPGNDLAAVSVDGNRVPMPGIASVYSIVVGNVGSETQSDYTVRLVDETGEVYASVPGVEIASGESKTFDLEWTPASGGVVNLLGEVFMANDEWDANNLTDAFKVYVRESGVEDIKIGTGEEKYKYPYNLYMRESVTQTLYLANEIGTNGGEIHSLVYQADVSHQGSNLQDVGVRIWMGETDVDNLKDGWIDPSSLTEVFNGTLSFPAGQYDVAIPLDKAYNYNGGTLVVYSFMSNAYNGEYTDNFIGTSIPNSYRSIAYSTFGGGISPASPPAFSEGEHGIPNTTFLIDMSGKGALHGIVTDGNGPVEDAMVRVDGSRLYSMTDASGAYSFSRLKQGTCRLEISKYGYTTQVVDVYVEADGTISKDITLMPLNSVTVSGRVTSAASEALADAQITLKGYKDYVATTDADGRYAIPEVYSGFIYGIECKLKGYITYSSVINVFESDVENDITLVEKAYPVVNLSAVVEADGAHVMWDAPIGFESKSFVYDDGGFETGWRNSNPELTAWFGTLFNEGGSGEITSVDVYGLKPMSGETSSTRTLTVEIFDENRELIGASEPFVLPGNAWINVPVDNVPYNGAFYVMVKWSPSSEGETNYLGYDQNGPYANLGTDYYCDSNIGWTTIYSMSEGIRGTMMVRANVDEDAVGVQPVSGRRIKTENVVSRIPSPVQYKVYRLAEGADEMSWAELGSVASTSYVDGDFATLPDGLYQYGVKAVYAGGNESVARLTSSVAQGLDVEVTVGVTTNSGVIPDGAIVTLSNQDETTGFVYTMTMSGNTVTFPAVRKGVYSLSVEMHGFDSYVKADLAIDKNCAYDVVLIETIVEPFGLKISEDTGNGSRIFSWNNAPLEETPMSYFSEPNYSYLSSIYQRKGEAYGVVFDLKDYTMAQPVRFDFYNSPWGHQGPSEYRVHVVDVDDSAELYVSEVLSTTTEIGWEEGIDIDVAENMAGKKIGIFIEPLSGTDDDAAPVLSADGITVNEHSCRINLETMEMSVISGMNENFSEYLMVLWIMAGDGSYVNVGSDGYPTYMVYLDDDFLGSTTKSSYEFPNLAYGTHTAGVKAVYTTGESAMASITFFVGESGLEPVGSDGLGVYGLKNRIALVNDAGLPISSMQVVDMMGMLVCEINNPEPGIVDTGLFAGCYVVRLMNGSESLLTAKIVLTE